MFPEGARTRTRTSISAIAQYPVPGTYSDRPVTTNETGAWTPNNKLG